MYLPGLPLARAELALPVPCPPFSKLHVVLLSLPAFSHMRCLRLPAAAEQTPPLPFLHRAAAVAWNGIAAERQAAPHRTATDRMPPYGQRVAAAYLEGVG